MGEKLRTREERAAKELEEAGMMISRPGERHPDWHEYWGVHTGSHGGYGKTLHGAMRACHRCCGIGAWWKLGDEKLEDVFVRVSEGWLGRDFFKAQKTEKTAA